MNGALAQARNCLATNDHEGALEALLEAWRGSRSPEVADLVDLVSARMGGLALRGGSSDKRLARFVGVAQKKSANELPRLLSLLGEMSIKAFAEQIEALAAWPDDPRIAARAVELVKHPKTRGASSFHCWQKLFALLARSKDVRAIPTLRAVDYGALFGVGSAAATFFAQRRDATLAALAEVRPDALSSEDASVIRAAFEGLRTDVLEPLFAAVYADPDDDGARQVLGDRLLERGDPRGELIAASYGGDLERAEKLLELHRDAWLGPFAKGLFHEGFAFHHGFPSAIDLVIGRKGIPEHLVGRPEWSTVRELDLRMSPEIPLPVELLRHPTMRSVVSLHLGTEQTFALWSSGPWPFRTITAGLLRSAPDALGEDLSRIARSESLPHLTALRLAGPDFGRKLADYAPFFETATFARLTRFGFGEGIQRLAEVVELVERHGLDDRLTCFDLAFDRAQRASLRRGPTGRLSELEVVRRPSKAPGLASSNTLAWQLGLLPPERLTHARLRGRFTADQRAAIEKALARQTGLELVTFAPAGRYDASYLP